MNNCKIHIKIFISFFIPFLYPLTLLAQTVPLEDAVRSGKVEIKIYGLGGSTGDTILIDITRRVPEKLHITLSPGTVFKSTTGNVQNMIGSKVKGERIGLNSYRPTSYIHLITDKMLSYIIEAYCLDFNKPNPGVDDNFTISHIDDRTKKIIIEGEKAKFSTQVIQSAIWIDRANVTPSQLKSRFSVSDNDIEVAKRLLGKINATAPLGATQKKSDKDSQSKEKIFNAKKLSIFLPEQIAGFIASKPAKLTEEKDYSRAARNYKGENGIWAIVAIDNGSKARKMYNNRKKPEKTTIHNYNAVWDFGANNAVALLVDVGPETIVWTIVFNTENRKLALNIIDKIDLISISNLSKQN